MTQSAPVKVLVLWADHRSANLGVRALAEGTKALVLRSLGNGVSVDFDHFGGGALNIESWRRSVLRDICFSSGPIKSKLREYDIVVDTGAGDSFADIYGPKRLLAIVYVQRAAKLAQVPIVQGPQTIGPFTTPYGRALGKYALGLMTSVIVRDPASADEATRMGRVPDARATDVVFALPPVARPKKRDVIINVSGLLWASDSHVKSATYRRNVRELVTTLQRRGRTVSLMAHVLDNPSIDNDVRAVRQLEASLEAPIETLIPDDLVDARGLLSSAKLVIGSRMHACLNALSCGVPALPWAYSRKFAPLLGELGWSHVIDLRKEDEPVQATVDFLEANSEKVLGEDVATLLSRVPSRLDAAAGALSRWSIASS